MTVFPTNSLICGKRVADYAKTGGGERKTKTSSDEEKQLIISFPLAMRLPWGTQCFVNGGEGRRERGKLLDERQPVSIGEIVENSQLTQQKSA